MPNFLKAEFAPQKYQNRTELVFRHSFFFKFTLFQEVLSLLGMLFRTYSSLKYLFKVRFGGFFANDTKFHLKLT
jgi:hypothetical protein